MTDTRDDTQTRAEDLAKKVDVLFSKQYAERLTYRELHILRCLLIILLEDTNF